MSTYLSWMWTHLGILVYWTRFGNLPNRQVRGTWEPTSYNEVKLKLINSHLERFVDLVRLSISNQPWTTRWEKQQSQPGEKEGCQISPGIIFWNSWDKIFQECTISAKYTDLFLLSTNPQTSIYQPQQDVVYLISTKYLRCILFIKPTIRLQ